MPNGHRNCHGKIIQPALAWLIVLLTLAAVADKKALAQEVTGAFVPIEVPGAQFTAAQAITADGRIVGVYTDANGLPHGFLLVDGSFTTVDVPVPGARLTAALGINSRGDIVGVWVDSTGAVHGYVLPANGPFTVVDLKTRFSQPLSGSILQET